MVCRSRRKNSPFFPCGQTSFPSPFFQWRMHHMAKNQYFQIQTYVYHFLACFMLLNFFLRRSVRKCKEKTLFSFKLRIFAPFPTIFLKNLKMQQICYHLQTNHSRLFLHLERGVPKTEFKINIVNTTKMLTLRTAYSSL